jgi:hypothetical protein
LSWITTISGKLNQRSGNLFDEAYPVVTHESDRAAQKRRQLATRLWNGCIDCGQLVSQILEGISLDLGSLGSTRLRPLDGFSAGAEERARASSHEAVAGPLFGTRDRLEEKARLTVVEAFEE